jgi:protein-disulfide isomerase
MSEKTKVLLFISKSSLYFQVTLEEFTKLMGALEKIQPFTQEIIDVTEHPEKAEEYKVDALPTIIIGNKRFIGQPNMEKIIHLLDPDEADDETKNPTQS